MTWTSRPLMSLVVVALLAGACGDGGDSIAGTYSCVAPEPPPAPGAEPLPEDPPDVLELREDGTLELTTRHPEGAPNPGETLEGTWSTEADSGVATYYEVDHPFTIEGDRLVFTELGTCTKAG